MMLYAAVRNISLALRKSVPEIVEEVEVPTGSNSLPLKATSSRNGRGNKSSHIKPYIYAKWTDKLFNTWLWPSKIWT